MSAAAFLALAAALCFAVALILTQYGLRTMPSWRSPLYSIGGSAVAAWILALAFVDPAGFQLEAALIFAGVGVIFPVAVSILSVRSNERLGPAVAGAVGNVTPVFAVLGAVLLLGEKVGLGQVAGSVDQDSSSEQKISSLPMTAARWPPPCCHRQGGGRDQAQRPLAAEADQAAAVVPTR